MRHLFDSNAPKKATNLTVNSDLLRAAKELDINISATLETALVNIVKARAKEKWIEENKQAIADYNEHVEIHGVFSDEFRSF